MAEGLGRNVLLLRLRYVWFPLMYDGLAHVVECA